eukprot:1161073-Pelagomonas_calceolata.AAC.2
MATSATSWLAEALLDRNLGSSCRHLPASAGPVLTDQTTWSEVSGCRLDFRVNIRVGASLAGTLLVGWHHLLMKRIHAFSSLCPPTDVCICATARTSFGAFNGKLSSLSAVQLGGEAIKGGVPGAVFKACPSCV